MYSKTQEPVSQVKKTAKLKENHGSISWFSFNLAGFFLPTIQVPAALGLGLSLRLVCQHKCHCAVHFGTRERVIE